MQKQKAYLRSQGFAAIILIVLVIIAGVMLFGYFYLSSKGLVPKIWTSNQSYQKMYEQASSEVPQINGASDLNTTVESIDEVDTTQIDAELKTLDSQSSSF